MTAANSQKRGDGQFSPQHDLVMCLDQVAQLYQFSNQIASGGPVTLTDQGMTRFVMSNADAVSLVLDSAEHARGEFLSQKCRCFAFRSCSSYDQYLSAPLWP